jgi:hypothetical protein
MMTASFFRLAGEDEVCGAGEAGVVILKFMSLNNITIPALLGVDSMKNVRLIGIYPVLPFFRRLIEPECVIAEPTNVDLNTRTAMDLSRQRTIPDTTRNADRNLFIHALISNKHIEVSEFPYSLGGAVKEF